MKKTILIVFYLIANRVVSQQYCNPTSLPTEIFPPNSTNSSTGYDIVQYLCGPNTILYDTIPYFGHLVYVEDYCKLIYVPSSPSIDNIWLKHTSELTLIDYMISNVIVHVEPGAIINQSPGNHLYHLSIDTCLNIVFPNIDCTTGIKENSQKDKFIVSPNPNNGEFVITGNPEINNIEIFDISGQSLYFELVNRVNPNISLANLNKGLYFIKISCDKNTNVIKKITIN